MLPIQTSEGEVTKVLSGERATAVSIYRGEEEDEGSLCLLL